MGKSQTALIREFSLQTDPSGAAIADYLQAVKALKEAGWTSESLKELARDDAQPPDIALGVLEEAAESVLRGAKRRNAGIPELPWFETQLTLGSDTVDMADLSLACNATLVVARRASRGADYERGYRLEGAVFAMGQHLAGSDNDLLSAIGIVCKQKVLDLLRETALEKGDSESAAEYDAIRADVDKELEIHKNRSHNREPGLRDIIDTMRQ
ncbi:MAG: hypothetical protein JXA69_07755 [Phycisphaerae bacterium]|nr:hypothetical protein [Phycisphaerae bacterium]